MKLSNADNFIASAAADPRAGVNGMYLLYTASPKNDIPAESGAVISGAMLQDIKSIVGGSSADMGLCRLPIIVSPSISSGAAVLSSGGGTYTFYATTAKTDNVCGMPFSAGVYARAAILANLDRGSNRENNYMYDTGLNYSELTTPVVAPANGAITVIEEVTL